MPLKLYNTLNRKKEVFKPIKKGKVGVYVCGPTVNGVPHLGHARQQITFDILRKYLRFIGYNVKFVSNITDIEDKIINVANEKGISVEELSKRNLKVHLENYKEIGVEEPDVRAFATKYVKEMIDLIKKLMDKGYAYVIEGDGVYYNLRKFKNYGKLSHQNIDNLKAGARIKVKKEKKNYGDFILWKFSKPNEPQWKSPWGEGRPGWHIECSAMSKSILGLPLDIHGGGQDLIFPHHEGEIAQSEAAYGKKLANYWVHNGMVNVDQVKMSKSLGNLRTIGDLLELYEGNEIRYFIISSHYRKPIDFSKKLLDQTKNSYKRLKNIISEIKDDKKTNKKYLDEFKKAMDDDLNTPKALQVLWKLIRDKNAKGKIATIKKMDEVLGLDLLRKEKIIKDKIKIKDKVKLIIYRGFKPTKELTELINKREESRAKKDWKKADELRNKINKLGYNIDDTKKGSVVKEK